MEPYIRPLSDQVLLRRDAPAAKTSGGLFIPPSRQDKSNHATVLAVGPGRVSDDGNLVPTTVREGQTVLVGKWAGHEVDEERLLLRESDILGVIED